jgi:hypothetical protein
MTEDLDAISGDSELPTAENVEARLRAEVREDAQVVSAFVGQQTSEMAESLAKLARAALDDSRMQLGIPVMPEDSIPTPSISALDLSLPEAGLGLVGLIGFLVNPFFGAMTTVLSFVFGGGIAVDRRRKRVLKDLAERYAEGLHGAHEEMLRQTKERVFNAGATVKLQIGSRLDTLISDAERRIRRLGAPLALGEGERLRAVTEDLTRPATGSDRGGACPSDT